MMDETQRISGSGRENVFQEAVERLGTGSSLESLMASYREDADWLEPLLKLTMSVREFGERVTAPPAQASLTRFLSQAAGLVSDPLHTPKERWVSSLGLAVLGRRRPAAIGAVCAGLGAVTVSVLMAWLVLAQPWADDPTLRSPGTSVPSMDSSRLVADFVVNTGQGTSFSLSEHGGNIVVLYFGFPDCPTCGLEAPALGRIQKEFNHRGVTVVAINSRPWTTLERWREFWKRIGADDVIWATDSDQTVGRLLQVTGVGTTMIIDRDRQLFFRDVGATPYETLRAAIESLL